MLSDEFLCDVSQPVVQFVTPPEALICSCLLVLQRDSAYALLIAFAYAMLPQHVS